MTLSNIRFGNIGVIVGPLDQSKQIAEHLGKAEDGIYYAENWSEQAKTGEAPVLAYVTKQHLSDLNGAQPNFDTLNALYHQEFKSGSSMEGPWGKGVISDCRSGKGLARRHVLSFQA